MGGAAKVMSVKAGQARELDTVADFRTASSRPPIPEWNEKAINHIQDNQLMYPLPRPSILTHLRIYDTIENPANYLIQL